MDEVLIDEGNCRVAYYSNFCGANHDKWFADLQQLDYKEETVLIFGKRSARTKLFYADVPEYRYGRKSHKPVGRMDDSPLCVQQIRKHVERFTGEQYNGVVINNYGDGKAGVAWHADDEPAMVPDSTIASVSFGAERKFVLRRNSDHKDKVSKRLAGGSLLTMAGETQRHWQHTLPKTSARNVGRRINLTFRRMRQAALRPKPKASPEPKPTLKREARASAQDARKKRKRAANVSIVQNKRSRVK